MADEPRFRGTVLWFSDRKGYGFITPEDDGEELFVHYSAIKSDGFRSLQVGGTVEYTFAVGGENKPKALDVTGPNGSSIAPPFGGCISYGDRGVNNGLRRTRNSSGVCFNCDSPGHLARDCTQSSGRCRKCKAYGHLARECTQTAGAYSSGSGGVGKCYSCDKPGHRARDCPYKAVGDGGTVSSGGKCYNCDQPGHLSRDCTEGDRGGSSSGNGRGGDRRGCFNCGNSGHMARNCPQEGKCYSCGEGGHLARDCGITA